MLARLQLYDAWEEVPYDSETQEVPPGYTYGYNLHNRPQPNGPRRLDKVHILARLKDAMATAYTPFVAQSDHKAVVADLAPPVFVQRAPARNAPWASSVLSSFEYYHTEIEWH